MIEGHKKDRSMVNGDLVKLKYPEVVEDNYIYRGAVENHNVLRHDGGTKYQIGLECHMSYYLVVVWYF